MVLFAFGLSVAGPRRVTVVCDGDTFRTTDGSVVRLLGIDAPEMATADRGQIEVLE
jgi:endonuclease YncB( thermonuclease family)